MTITQEPTDGADVLVAVPLARTEITIASPSAPANSPWHNNVTGGEAGR
ncbi:hypothetical protein [Streptomyces sp. G-G2]|nr:hypothetical protein [Streptomyces sp. G-G2]MDJ0385818.1 hypothetical protein [Streptomyces sp. G-G2]